ncbi:MAG: hypothetical protein HZA46_05915 [Planctomycetales bacterium]|nr:hypothetical protein [Planctomycetales bacterium]
MAELPSVEQLNQLSHRAIVAYTVRCARRAQPITAMMPPTLKGLQIELEKALRRGERFAMGEVFLPSWLNSRYKKLRLSVRSIITKPEGAVSDAVSAAVAAATVTAAQNSARAADVASRAAMHSYAAVATFGNASSRAANEKSVVDSTKSDYAILLKMSRSEIAKFDATEAGACGPYWKRTVPEWDRGLRQELDRVFEGLEGEEARLYSAPELESNSSNSTATLEEVLRKSQTKIESLSKEVQESQHELAELRVRVSLTETERKQLAREREAAEAHRHETQSELSRVREEFQLTQKERDRLSDHLAQIEGQKEKLLAELTMVSQRWEYAEKARTEEILRSEDLKRELLSLTREFEQTKAKLDYERVQPIRWYRDELLKPSSLFQVAAVGVLFLVVGAALLVITEIHGRQSFDRLLKSQIEDLRDSTGATPESTPDAATPWKARHEFQALRSRLQALSAIGASHELETVNGLRNDFKQLLNGKVSPTLPDSVVAGTGWWWFWPPNWLQRMNSDFLLSLAVVLSGTVGAAIAAMRSRNRLGVRDLALGIAAGFITFLVVRGGKSVFLVDGGDSTLLLNPYNSAFFGLLTGLFTDLAFELLRDLAKEIVKKLRSAFLSEHTSETHSGSETLHERRKTQVAIGSQTVSASVSAIPVTSAEPTVGAPSVGDETSPPEPKPVTATS